MNWGGLEQVTGTVIAVNQAADEAALSGALADGFRALGFSAYRLGCHKKDWRDWVLHPTLSSGAQGGEASPAWGWHGAESDFETINTPWAISLGMRDPAVGGPAVTIPLRNRPGTISALSVEAESAKVPSREVIGALAIIGSTAQLKAEALGLCAEGPAPDSPLARLTDKQREILVWATQGKSTGDIAAIMGVKDRTVKYHFDEILRKLQVRTRTQAVAMFAKAA